MSDDDLPTPAELVDHNGGSNGPDMATVLAVLGIIAVCVLLAVLL